MGKYVLSAKLGSGGMGDVWKAWDSELERWVALKLLRHDDPRELERFTREARTAAALTHPNIAAVYEAGKSDGKHYIAMQLVVGRTMDCWVRGELRKVATMVRDAARAVGFAHKHGVVHRDLKPTNLMVASEDSGSHVFVMDFGLARKIDGGARLSGTGVMAGTPSYMSPEQTRGRRADARSDVYSLGVTLYELLTGRPPFESDDLYELLRKITDAEPAPPRTVNRGIDRDLDTIILKCLEKDPARRYATAEALARDLDCWLKGDPILARPASSFYRIAKKLAKRKAIVIASAATFGLIVTAAVVVPMWRSEAAALSKHQIEARHKHARFERARPHLESGRTILQRMKLRKREAYTQEDLKALGALARIQFSRALEVAPDHPEGHHGIAIAFGLVADHKSALEALARAIEADREFAPAYLERVRLLIDHYEEMRHDRTGGVLSETPEAKKLRERLESDLEKAEGYSREYPQQRYAQGLLAFAHGEFAKAADELGRYLEVDAEDDRAHAWRGHALVHLNRNSEAIEALTRAIACDTRRLHAYLMRGTAKVAQGLYDEAIEDDTKAIELNPKNPNAWYNRGTARGKKGAHAEAIEDFSKAIEIDQEFSDAYTNRGACYCKMGLYDEAIKDCTKAIGFNPSQPTALVVRGVARVAKSLYDDAMDDFNKAIQLDPKNAGALYNRGRAKGIRGAHKEGIEDLTKAIAVDAKFGDAYGCRAVARAKLGLLGEAIEDYSMVITLGPTIAQAWYNRGDAKYQMGAMDSALEDFTKAIELDPKMAEGYTARGVCKDLQGRYDEAIDDHTKAIALDPGNARAYSNRGVCKFYKGQYDAAIHDHTKAIELKPTNAMAYANRGIAKSAMGLTDEAITDCDKAIALEPKNAIAYNARANARVRKGFLDGAVADYNMAIACDPKFVEAYISLGSALCKLDQLDAAIQNYKRVLTLYPGFATALYGLGAALGQKGLYDEALQHYDDAIKADPKSVEARINRGAIKALRGLHEAAIVDLDEAIRLNSKHVLAFYNRGRSRRALRMYEGAIGDFLEATRLDPKYAPAHALLGEARLGMNQIDLAIESLSESLKLDPRFPPAFFNRGNAKRMKGELEGAISDFSEAIKLNPKYAEAHTNRGNLKAILHRLDEAVSDWETALRVAPPGWRYRDVVEERVKTGGASLLFSEAVNLVKENRHKESIEAHKFLIAKFPGSKQGVDSAFKIACVHAVIGEKKYAFDWIERAIEMGWKDLPQLEKDPDLDTIRDAERYKRIVEKLKRESTEK